MANVIPKFIGKLKDKDIDLTCCDGNLFVKISQPNKFSFWNGKVSSETIKEKHPETIGSAQELFEAIVDVLCDRATNESVILWNETKHLIEYSFCLFRKR